MRRPWALFAVALLGLGCSHPTAPNGATGAASEPWFEEQAAARGIDFLHRTGHAGAHLLPEVVNGGAVLADVDNDGDLDVYLVQGGSLHAATEHGNRLYLNAGDGRFEAAQNSGADDRGYGIGAAAGDYDGDGDIDIYVTNSGANALLRNDEGRFENVASQAGVADPGFGTAAFFSDVDADGDLDLFVANYVRWRLAVEMECYLDGVITYCPPQNYNAPAPDKLFRNDGDGSFTDVTAAAGLGRAFGNGLGATAADFNGDGRIDLFVANDMTVNQLWMNAGGLRFREEAAFRGCAVDENGVAKAGMGVATGDIDADGDADLLVVNLRGQTDSFFRNAGEWFEDATVSVGLSTTSRRYTRFGVVLADFDNDGHLDMYQANGRVAPGETAQAQQDAYAQPNVLYRGTADGRFEERPGGGVAVPLIHTSRAVAVGDVDNDGGLDLLVANRDARPYLLLNRVPNRGNWIRFRLLAANGVDAYGAVVSAVVGGQRRSREVDPEGSYLASSDPRPHFGLGAEAGVGDVRVRWVSGTLESFGDFANGQTVTLREGTGQLPAR